MPPTLPQGRPASRGQASPFPAGTPASGPSDAPTAAAPRDQIAMAFRAVCTREARPTELTALERLYADQKALVAAEVPAPPPPAPDAKPKKAAAKPADPAMVALTRVCATVFASDAAVTSR